MNTSIDRLSVSFYQFANIIPVCYIYLNYQEINYKIFETFLFSSIYFSF